MALLDNIDMKNLSHVGMIIHTTTLDTMEKVIELYGGTTWEKIEGRFLLGVSASHAINTTGGEESHTLTLTEIPSHNHSIPALSGTAASDGAHTHSVWGQGYYGFCRDNNAPNIACQAWRQQTTDTAYTIGGTNSAGAHTHKVTTTASTTGAKGGSSAHNNMPPFKTVYIWERTE